MSKPIQRWIASDLPGPLMQRRPNGDWVLHSDHAAQVRELEARVKELENFVEQVAYKEEFRGKTDYATWLELGTRAVALLDETALASQAPSVEPSEKCSHVFNVEKNACIYCLAEPPAKSEPSEFENVTNADLAQVVKEKWPEAPYPSEDYFIRGVRYAINQLTAKKQGQG